MHSEPAGLTPSAKSRVLEALKEHWGFDSLRPVQEHAIAADLAGRDSLVVMPTGGGKSLCFQVPPLVADKLTVVISPLIALMKDQVDGLQLVGYQAAALNSSLSPQEAGRTLDDMAQGNLRLLYVSPERLFTGNFISRMIDAKVRAIAIDEAHCISQWGHDFRPEYRRLRELRDALPKAAIHAFTATATPRVREDIIQQLGLRDPAVMVGIFDRPNLTYRVLPREAEVAQIAQAVKRHADQASIVYCITRKDTERIAEALKSMHIDARAYHAGMDPKSRKRVQEDFAEERLSVVVATVAFGMGIDRSDVRCVVHAALPKSIEHYQQETGRAGRDGLPAECLLLYSAGDVSRWSRIFDMAVQEGTGSEEWRQHRLDLVDEVRNLCNSGVCRHKRLSEYFGQTYTPPEGAENSSCGACDVCMGEVVTVTDSKVIAQKILSCIARANLTRSYDGRPMSFGAAHIASILMGANLKPIRDWEHDKLSTFGLLRDADKESIQNWINQLVDQGLILREAGKFATLRLGPGALAVLKGEQEVRLVAPKAELAAEEAAVPFDDAVFQLLRSIRRTIAQERNIPPYLVFSDNTLQDMARARPTTPDTFRTIPGVGDHKAAEFGPAFMDALARYCAANSLETNLSISTARAPRAKPLRVGSSKLESFRRFDKGESVETVAAAHGFALSTINTHLCDYIKERQPKDVTRWIDPKTYDLIIQTAAKLGAESSRPIFDYLEAKVTWDEIRIAMVHSTMLASMTTEQPAVSTGASRNAVK
ncbi:MAG: DNA helicase RecQ [Planctomycetota bacterium]